MDLTKNKIEIDHKCNERKERNVHISLRTKLIVFFCSINSVKYNFRNKFYFFSFFKKYIDNLYLEKARIYLSF